jgi:flagellar biosynthesis protein FliP
MSPFSLIGPIAEGLGAWAVLMLCPDRLSLPRKILVGVVLVLVGSINYAAGLWSQVL